MRKKTIEEARECAAEFGGTRTEFRVANRTCYDLLRKAGELDEYFVNLMQKTTLSEARESAGRFTGTRTEFNKVNHACYKRLSEAGELDEYFVNLMQKITIDEARECAVEFAGTRSEFKNAKRTCYNRLSEAGELDKYIPPIGSLFARCVYRIINPTLRSIYFGLTYDINKRMTKHLLEKSWVSHPDTTIQIMSDGYIDALKAVHCEKYLIKFFRTFSNYTVTNKSEGGELGAVSKENQTKLVAHYGEDILQYIRA